MTIEEAKNILINRGFVEINGDQVFDGNKWRNAIAVISKWLEQESIGDCISRQAVLGQAVDYGSNTYLIPVNSVKTLPTVTPKEKTAAWVPTDEEPYEAYGGRFAKCNACGWLLYDIDRKDFKYCPNCGAKMIEPQERG